MEIILIHGDNESQIEQVIVQWKESFKQKYPNSEVEKFDNLNYQQIYNLALKSDMFADKKLYILQNSINNIAKEEFNKIFNIETQDIILFLEKSIVRKNLKVFKEIEKNHKIYSYLLKDFNLKKYIEQELKKYNKTINPINLNLLHNKLLNQINNAALEINKLCLIETQEITKDHIDQHIIANLETSIFELTNNLFQNKTNYLQTLNNLKIENIEEIYIINMLIWQLKTLSQIKLNDTKNLNPFVVRNNSQVAKQITIQQLQETLNQILDIEYQIKTGKIKTRQESYQYLQDLV